jgi:predicted DNA-binding transcriptional regulator AlpA
MTSDNRSMEGGTRGSSSDEQPYFLDVDRVGALFGGSRPLSPSTIYRMIKAGHVPPPVRVGGSSRWLRSECERAREHMIAERNKPHTIASEPLGASAACYDGVIEGHVPAKVDCASTEPRGFGAARSRPLPKSS